MDDVSAMEDSKAVVQRLLEINIKLVAIDFDRTLVDLHTDRGDIPDIAALSRNLRPFFARFIPLALEHNILIAIVTFSRHVEMIYSLLQYTYGKIIADRIIIRGNDNSWEYVGGGSREGKQSHMASAAEFLARSHGVSLCRSHTILIDDDMDNIEVALQNSVRAVQCDPMNPMRLITELKNLS